MVQTVKTQPSTNLLFNAFQGEIIKNIKEGDKILQDIIIQGTKEKLMLHGKTLKGAFKIDLSTPNERLLMNGIPEDPQFERMKDLAVEIMGRKSDQDFAASTFGDRYYQWK